MGRLINSLSYANVVSTLAIVLAVGGGAALAVTKAARNSVVSKSIRDGAVTGTDVKDGSVTGVDVGDGSLGGTDIDEASLSLPRDEGPREPIGPAGADLTGTYPDPRIAPDAVDSSKVADESLSGLDIEDGSITGNDILDGTITASEFLDNSIGGFAIDEESLDAVVEARQGGTGRYGFDGSCDPPHGEVLTCSDVTVPHDRNARLLVVGTVRAEPDAGHTSGIGHCGIVTTDGPIVNSFDTFSGAEAEHQSGTVIAVSNVLEAGNDRVALVCDEAGAPTTGITYPQARVVAVALSGL